MGCAHAPAHDKFCQKVIRILFYPKKHQRSSSSFEFCDLFFSDVDECKSGTAQCTQICTKTSDSYECSCNEGYKLDEDGFTCGGGDFCQGVLSMWHKNLHKTQHSTTLNCCHVTYCTYFTDLCIQVASTAKI